MARTIGLKTRQELPQSEYETQAGQRHCLTMNRKRAVLVIALVAILSFSLFYYLFSTVFRPLRIDSVPTGTYIIPWIYPNPSVNEIEISQFSLWPSPYEWYVDSVMYNSLRLNVTFNMQTPNGTRSVPSTIYLGHDKEYLYVGAELRQIFVNITQHSMGLSSCLSLFFDVDHDGVLTFPESGSEFPSSIFPSKNWFPSGVWYYDDVLWVEDRKGYSEPDWVSMNDYYNFYSRGSIPRSSVDSFTVEYDNLTGTLALLFSRRLNNPSNSAVNRLQMRPGERWVMGFNIELIVDYEAYRNTPFLDNWPKVEYAHSLNDASWWPRLAIDLSNPPPTY